MESILGIRRARWIEKLANMKSTRNPRKILHAWMPQARPTGKPNQSIRKALADELRLLGTTSELKTFIPLARDKYTWSDMVERSLGLAPGTYIKYKQRNGRTTQGVGYRRRTNRSTNGGHQPATQTTSNRIFVYDPLGEHRHLNYHEAEDAHARRQGYASAEIRFQEFAQSIINRNRNNS